MRRASARPITLYPSAWWGIRMKRASPQSGWVSKHGGGGGTEREGAQAHNSWTQGGVWGGLRVQTRITCRRGDVVGQWEECRHAPASPSTQILSSAGVKGGGGAPPSPGRQIAPLAAGVGVWVVRASRGGVRVWRNGGVG